MLIKLAGAVLAIVAAGYGVGRFRRWLDRQWFLIAAWAWLSGGEGFNRGRRAGRRCGSAAGAIGLVWLWLAMPVAALAVTFAGAVTLSGYGGWRGWRLVTGWRHQRTWLRPLHLAARNIAQIEPWRAPGSWLEVSRDRSRAVLALPAGWPADEKDKQRLLAITTAKLGIKDPEVSWHLAGPKPKLELTRAQPPPARVSFADVREALERAREDELVWGIGRRAAVVSSSLSSDSPHLGLSMGSGAGKSVTARALLAQMLHKGAIGLILDLKKNSHMWARDLPNVALAHDPADIHRALRWLGAEMGRRNEVAYRGSDIEGNVHANVGPRIIVLCEELNATVAKLRDWWRENRDRDDPVRSPALSSLDDVSFMGRAVRANLIYIGQRLSDRATGGAGDARENMGVIAFARWRKSTWAMLAPDFAPPPKSLTPGRLQVVSEEVEEVQGVLMTAVEARDWAVSGIVSALPFGMPGRPSVLDATQEELVGGDGPDVPFVSGTSPVVPALPGLVTLSEAVAEGIVSRSLHAIRKASQRDPEFPKRAGLRGLAGEYDPLALSDWDAAGRRL